MREDKSCCTQFWLRKLHSFTGILFLGYFLLYHLQGELPYDSMLSRELFLYIPLTFHAIYGLWIVFEARPNFMTFPLIRNGMFLMQRVTGLIILPFVILHALAMNHSVGYDSEGWFLALWYAGVVAAVFHLANGLFGAAIHWGITVGDRSQRVLVGVAFLTFAVLAAFGVNTLVNF
ncbi:MAG: hypothetical protein C0609_07470 [Deltaproteobacteria bacterium]|nr:MAG: hypothetical protein C0609_07470 [Deltaproteobacteria bacterium]